MPEGTSCAVSMKKVPDATESDGRSLMDSGIKPCADEIDATLLCGGELQHYVWILTGEWRPW